MGTLSYVNVFARDIEALSVFYRDLFGFKEIPEIRSPIFRGLDTGRSCIGFNALDAYELLKLNDYSDTKGCKFLLNIDVDSKEEENNEQLQLETDRRIIEQSISSKKKFT